MIILDLETTGLDPHKNVILEVAALRVDNDLSYIGPSFQRVVWQHEDLLRNLSLEVLKMHTDNALLTEVDDASPENSWIERVEDELLLWLADEPAPRYLAGDSIHFDRSFLAVHMPRVVAALHHRMVDTSSFRVAHELWNRPVAPNSFRSPASDASPNAGPPKPPGHRALSDCYVSLEKLRFYKGLGA